MKILVVLIILLYLSTISAQSDTTIIVEHDLNAISGTWIIDLRATPESDPYLKDFLINYKEDNNFSGEFYDTKFDNGRLNSNWERIYFAFTTNDESSSYYHSGYIEGDKIDGITYSPERNFTMPWRGKRK